MTPARRHSGFTLLELSIVLIVISLIVAMGLSIGKGVIESTTRTSTNRKLDQLEKTLMDFRTANNRLPCPTDATLLESDVNYGVESVNGGACTTGSTYDATTGIRTVAANPGPTANYLDKKHNVAEGAVPFKTLNLPKEFMYDGWGRKFAYAVNYNATSPLAMLGQTLNESCQITINDASGNPRSSGAIYTLLSYGEDGHGGYLKSGVRNNAGSTNTDELTNCHCDTANAAETTYAASYVGKEATADPTTSTNQFGDLIRFKDRWQMMTYDDQNTAIGGPVCQLGFRADGMNAGGLSGAGGVFVGDVNGDGIADLVISAADAYYVVFGTKTGFPNPLPLDTLDGTNGFKIWGFRHYGQTGQVLGVGDVSGHGNGLNDIVLSDLDNATANFSIFVLFGHTGPWPAVIDNLNNNPAALDGTNGFQLHKAGVAYNWAYQRAGGAGVGDLNGDGLADMFFYDNTNHRYYVIFGKNNWTGTGGVFDPTALADGTQGFWLADDVGALYQGWPTFADVKGHGDGTQDLLFMSVAGRLNIIFGHSKTSGFDWGTVNTHNFSWMMDGTHGTYFYDASTAGLGHSSAVGDIIGDGNKELIISGSAVNWNNYGTVNGNTAYVVPLNGFVWGSASYEIANLVSTNKAYWIVGDSGSGGGFNGAFDGGFDKIITADINHDGINDIVLACPNCSLDSPHGSLYVIYGHQGAWNDIDLNITPLNGTNGFRIDCSYASDTGNCGGEGAGRGGTTAVDLNGDGTSDLMINVETGTTAAGGNSGYTYVLYGKRKAFTNPFPLSNIQ